MAGGNNSKPSESAQEPAIQGNGSHGKWALPRVAEIAARTPRPRTRDYELQPWQAAGNNALYLPASANTMYRVAGQRNAPTAATNTSLMELRWKLAGEHRSVPTFELAGCDVISQRDFYPAPQATPAVADAQHPGRLQRARHMVSNKISSFMHSGCD